MDVTSTSALGIWGAVFCLIAAVAIDRGKKVERRENIQLGYMLAINSIMLVAVVITRQYIGTSGFIATSFLRAGMFLGFAMAYLLCYFIVKYVDAIIQTAGGTLNPKFIILAKTMTAIAYAVLIINLYAGSLYEVDPLNNVVRGNYYFLSALFPFVIFIASLVAVILYRKYISTMHMVGMACVILLPALAMVTEILSKDGFGLFFVMIAFTASLLVLYVLYEIQRADRMVADAETLLEKERANNQFKNAMLWSQVQPHFIYNNLNVIQFLCKKDPDEAQVAIGHLSSFLRNYIDAYDLDVCVPVEEELEIVNHYIYMQKLRYGDRLKITTTLDSVDFMVPPLCIEVLVENAVKHGVMKKVEGGDVLIHLYETDDEYIAMVQDNGVGFDSEEIMHDGKNHVGLKNADGRLKYMSKGYLEVHSAVGEGCCVKIHIPKEKK